MAAAAADFDNDGWTDLFVAGVNRNILYRNRGDGTLRRCHLQGRPGRLEGRPSRGPSPPAGSTTTTTAGSTCSSPTTLQWDPATRAPLRPVRTTASTATPTSTAGCPTSSFTTTATAPSPTSRRASGIARHTGKGMGVAFADFDGDGFTDIFVANDSVRHFLFRNRGGRNVRRDRPRSRRGAARRRRRPSPAWAPTSATSTTTACPDIVVSGMINDGFLLFRNRGTRGCTSRTPARAPAC